MDSTSTGLRMRRRGAILLALAGFAVVALLWGATGARAAELLYWDNYGNEPATIGVANVDGSGASLLNLAGAQVLNPEGMAIDTAGGRLFVASSGETEYDAETETNKVTIPGKIVVANLDGSGATVFAPPGAPVDEPEGIAIDPATGLVFWANVGTGESKGSIAWAKLDGSAGGVLATPGVVVNGPYRIGVDPATARVFWDNAGDEPERIAFAAENGTGGGYLDITGATSPPDVSGFAVDSAAGRVYWIDHGKKYVSFANVGGGGGGDIDMSGATVNSPYGLAFDPTLARLYWGNYGNGTEAIGAFGFSDLLGVGGGIDIAGVPVSGPQDPVILKSPTGTGAPALTRAKSSRSKLQCSTGSWAADYAGAFVYQAPTTYAYQWAKGGTPIAGATAATYAAKSAAAYTCTVSGANAAGSARADLGSDQGQGGEAEALDQEEGQGQGRQARHLQGQGRQPGRPQDRQGARLRQARRQGEEGAEAAEVQAARQDRRRQEEDDQGEGAGQGQRRARHLQAGLPAQGRQGQEREGQGRRHRLTLVTAWQSFPCTQGEATATPRFPSSSIALQLLTATALESHAAAGVSNPATFVTPGPGFESQSRHEML